MEPAGFRLVDAIAVLERTPASLAAMLDGLPGAWTSVTEGEGTWSPTEVVIHLLHVERTAWLVRTRHILSASGEPFAPLDRTGGNAEWGDRPLTAVLAAFADLRRASLAEIVRLDLSAADLGRKGRHPEFGEITLAQLLATWVVHDLDHLAQIARIMAGAYAPETGPWSAYLPILRGRKPAPNGA